MDFMCDLKKVERKMDAFPFIQAMLSEPALRVLLSDNRPVDVDSESLKWLIHFPSHFEEKNGKNHIYPSDYPSENLHDELPGDVEFLRVKSRQLGYAIREIIRLSPRSRSKVQSFLEECRMYINHIFRYMKCMVKSIETEGVLELKERDAVLNSVDDIKGIEDLLPDKTDSSYCLTNKEKCQALFLMTVFPALCEMKEPVEILWFLLDLYIELDNFPELICEACEGQPLAFLLIGTVISLKPRDYDTWAKVIDDLDKIKKSDYHDSADNPNHGTLAKLLEKMEKIKESDSGDSDNGATNHLPRHIFIYCFSDLSLSLKSCLLYLACYPIDYEIPVKSLIEIWIAEEFITPHEGETLEETAYKYLEQLLQRLWVRVSKRTLLGTIKCCRVRQPIHELIIKESWREGFLAANPDAKKNIKSFTRLAIYHGNKCVFPDKKFYSKYLRSFLAFDCDWGLPLSPDCLRVLELNKSPIPVLWDCEHKGSRLVYVCLRGSKIYDLPKYIGKVYFLQTLDIRDTPIETLPEYIWDILTLRHIYVNPSPQIKGPPSKAYTQNLQILKTVGVPESWLEIEKFPHFLINLRKLALSTTNSPDCKSNPYWKPISILLSRMDHLISLAITGEIISSKFVDVRVFPNLKTVISIKLEGEWICRKLFIDHVEFPPNLTKLTLTKSGLKEDPMPRLERLQALKFLSLQDGVYMGDQMVCSANGFPQLQIMELKKLNLKNLEVKPMGMSQLATLRVVLCPNLKKPSHLEHVTIEGIDNPRILENVTIEYIGNLENVTIEYIGN